MGQRVEKNLEVGQFGGNLCTKEREQRKQASKTKKERRKMGKPAEKLHFLLIFEKKKIFSLSGTVNFRGPKNSLKWDTHLSGTKRVFKVQLT